MSLSSPAFVRPNRARVDRPSSSVPRSEIALLERKRDRNKARTGLDALETKKLERLEKELRIVSAAAAKRKALLEEAQLQADKELVAHQKTVAGVQKLNEAKYGLVERYASVYYDERMNPFGAPEPGKPKMYWADEEGKTKTLDARRAVVPRRHRDKFDAERGTNAEQEPERGGERLRRRRRLQLQPLNNPNLLFALRMKKIL